MKIFLLVIGIFWVIIGTLSIFATDLVRKKFFSKFKNMDYRKWSFIPLAVGILFIISARQTRALIFVVILGLLGVGKGLYLLLGPIDKIRTGASPCRECKQKKALGPRL